MWVILPGLALAPRDYAALAAHLPGRTLVLDSWSLPTTAGQLGNGVCSIAAERIDLIGHSIGGLAALEWALTNTANSLTLLDPTTLGEASSPSLPVHAAAPIGPLVRKLAMLALVGRDGLSPAERRARFGTVAGLRAINAQLRQLPELQARVATLLHSAAGLSLPPTLHIAALPRIGSGTHRFAQRALAARIGTEVVEIPGWNHLFPLAHPAEVAALITARRA